MLPRKLRVNWKTLAQSSKSNKTFSFKIESRPFKRQSCWLDAAASGALAVYDLLYPDDLQRGIQKLIRDIWTVQA